MGNASSMEHTKEIGTMISTPSRTSKHASPASSTPWIRRIRFPALFPSQQSHPNPHNRGRMRKKNEKYVLSTTSSASDLHAQIEAWSSKIAALTHGEASFARESILEEEEDELLKKLAEKRRKTREEGPSSGRRNSSSSFAETLVVLAKDVSIGHVRAQLSVDEGLRMENGDRESQRQHDRERMDLLHNCLCYSLRKLHVARIDIASAPSDAETRTAKISHILDINNGSDAWVKDISRKYPTAKVHSLEHCPGWRARHGTRQRAASQRPSSSNVHRRSKSVHTKHPSISKVPSLGSTNVYYDIADVTNGFPYPEGAFVYIRQCQMMQHIPQDACAKYIKRISRLLKPGVGRLEVVQVDTTLQPTSQKVTSSPFQRRRGMTTHQTPPSFENGILSDSALQTMTGLLETHGFCDIVVHRFQLPVGQDEGGVLGGLVQEWVQGEQDAIGVTPDDDIDMLNVLNPIYVQRDRSNTFLTTASIANPNSMRSQHDRNMHTSETSWQSVRDVTGHSAPVMWNGTAHGEYLCKEEFSENEEKGMTGTVLGVVLTARKCDVVKTSASGHFRTRNS